MRKILSVAACVLAIAAAGDLRPSTRASAEVLMNFLAANPDDLRAASAELINTVSDIVRAVGLAEQGSTNDAEGLLRGSVEKLQAIRDRFQEIAKTSNQGQAIPAMKESSVSKGEVENIFKRYGLILPSTQDGLANLAVEEVDRFVGQSKDLSLVDEGVARASVLVLSAAMRRLFDVGVAVSALSAS